MRLGARQCSTIKRPAKYWTGAPAPRLMPFVSWNFIVPACILPMPWFVLCHVYFSFYTDVLPFFIFSRYFLQCALPYPIRGTLVRAFVRCLKSPNVVKGIYCTWYTFRWPISTDLLGGGGCRYVSRRYWRACAYLLRFLSTNITLWDCSRKVAVYDFAIYPVSLRRYRQQQHHSY